MSEIDQRVNGQTYNWKPVVATITLTREGIERLEAEAAGLREILEGIRQSGGEAPLALAAVLEDAESILRQAAVGR